MSYLHRTHLFFRLAIRDRTLTGSVNCVNWAFSEYAVPLICEGKSGIVFTLIISSKDGGSQNRSYRVHQRERRPSNQMDEFHQWVAGMYTFRRGCLLHPLPESCSNKVYSFLDLMQLRYFVLSGIILRYFTVSRASNWLLWMKKRGGGSSISRVWQINTVCECIENTRSFPTFHASICMGLLGGVSFCRAELRFLCDFFHLFFFFFFAVDNCHGPYKLQRWEIFILRAGKLLLFGF